jgi:vesicle coat complex subunit
MNPMLYYTKQVFILDSLAKYTPVDGREAEGIIERVTPRLQHANSAVVMSAVKASATINTWLLLILALLIMCYAPACLYQCLYLLIV